MEFKHTNRQQFYLLFYLVQIHGPIPMKFVWKERYEVEGKRTKYGVLSSFYFHKRFVPYHLSRHQFLKCMCTLKWE